MPAGPRPDPQTPLPRPPWALAAVVAAGQLLLLLQELLLGDSPRDHRLVAVAIVLASALASSILLRAWHRQFHRARADREADEAERALHAQAFAELHEAVVIIDAALRITAWNQAAERLYGFARGEVLGRRADEVLAPEPPGGEIPAALERARREGRVQLETCLRRRDGGTVDVRLLLTRALGPTGEVRAFVGVHRDITEERRHGEAMRAAEAQIELLTSRAPAGIFQYDGGERLVYLNEMLCALTGLPPERLMKDGWLQAVVPEDQRAVVGAWRQAVAEVRPFRAEFRIGLDGTPVWVHAVAMPLRDDEGRQTGMVGVMTDVTEARRLKEQLARAERLASLGTLAAGLAHEINNPLAAVRSGLAFAREEVAGRPGLEDAADALADAASGVERVGVLVRELQSFAEARDRLEPVDAAALAAEVHSALPELLRCRGRFTVEASAAPRAQASRRQLGRVLEHLVRNALQALPASGARRGSVEVRVRAAEAGGVAIEVADDGQGVPAGLLARVFDPFFTTREVGQGQGLGLAVCLALARAMGGDLELESEVGRGTLARLSLPGAGGFAAPAPEDDAATLSRAAASF